MLKSLLLSLFPHLKCNFSQPRAAHLVKIFTHVAFSFPAFAISLKIEMLVSEPYTHVASVDSWQSTYLSAENEIQRSECGVTISASRLPSVFLSRFFYLSAANENLL